MANNSSDETIQSILQIPKREIWIITAASAEQRGGLVATYVSSGSINPETPTLVIAIAKNHFTRELIDHSQAFVAHLITTEQTELAWQFGIGSGRDRDKFAGADYRLGETSTPILSNSLAYLETQVLRSIDAGDRIYYWGNILHGEILNSGNPLTDHELINAATDEQKKQLTIGKEADIEIQKPMFDSWVQQAKSRE